MFLFQEYAYPKMADKKLDAKIGNVIYYNGGDGAQFKLQQKKVSIEVRMDKTYASLFVSGVKVAFYKKGDGVTFLNDDLKANSSEKDIINLISKLISKKNQVDPEKDIKDAYNSLLKQHPEWGEKEKKEVWSYLKTYGLSDIKLEEYKPVDNQNPFTAHIGVKENSVQDEAQELFDGILRGSINTADLTALQILQVTARCLKTMENDNRRDAVFFTHISESPVLDSDSPKVFAKLLSEEFARKTILASFGPGSAQNESFMKYLQATGGWSYFQREDFKNESPPSWWPYSVNLPESIPKDLENLGNKTPKPLISDDEVQRSISKYGQKITWDQNNRELIINNPSFNEVFLSNFPLIDPTALLEKVKNKEPFTKDDLDWTLLSSLYQWIPGAMIDVPSRQFNVRAKEFEKKKSITYEDLKEMVGFKDGLDDQRTFAIIMSAVIALQSVGEIAGAVASRLGARFSIEADMSFKRGLVKKLFTEEYQIQKNLALREGKVLLPEELFDRTVKNVQLDLIQLLEMDKDSPLRNMKSGDALSHPFKSRDIIRAVSKELGIEERLEKSRITPAEVLKEGDFWIVEKEPVIKEKPVIPPTNMEMQPSFSQIENSSVQSTTILGSEPQQALVTNEYANIFGKYYSEVVKIASSGLSSIEIQTEINRLYDDLPQTLKSKFFDGHVKASHSFNINIDRLQDGVTQFNSTEFANKVGFTTKLETLLSQELNDHTVEQVRHIIEQSGAVLKEPYPGVYVVEVQDLEPLRKFGLLGDETGGVTYHRYSMKGMVSFAITTKEAGVSPHEMHHLIWRALELQGEVAPITEKGELSMAFRHFRQEAGAYIFSRQTGGVEFSQVDPESIVYSKNQNILDMGEKYRDIVSICIDFAEKRGISQNDFLYALANSGSFEQLEKNFIKLVFPKNADTNTLMAIREFDAGLMWAGQDAFQGLFSDLVRKSGMNIDDAVVNAFPDEVYKDALYIISKEGTRVLDPVLHKKWVYDRAFEFCEKYFGKRPVNSTLTNETQTLAEPLKIKPINVKVSEYVHGEVYKANLYLADGDLENAARNFSDAATHSYIGLEKKMLRQKAMECYKELENLFRTGGNLEKAALMCEKMAHIGGYFEAPEFYQKAEDYYLAAGNLEKATEMHYRIPLKAGDLQRPFHAKYGHKEGNHILSIKPDLQRPFKYDANNNPFLQSVGASDPYGIQVAYGVALGLKPVGEYEVGPEFIAAHNTSKPWKIISPRYGTFYVQIDNRINNLVLAKDKSLLQMYRKGSKIQKPDLFIHNGKLFGYPQESIDYFMKTKVPALEYFSALYDNNTLLEPWSWRMIHVPGFENGKILGSDYLKQYHLELKKELDPILFETLNIFNKYDIAFEVSQSHYNLERFSSP